MDRSTKTTLPRIYAKAAGVALNIFIGSKFWAPKELEDIYGAGGGDPILWGLTALPIIAIFFA